jgi:hypothetical protein
MHIEADRELAEKARAQHGIFTSQQAVDAGHPRWRIEYRRKCGMWVRLHPNVYTHASTPSTWHRDQMAAVMWAQPAATSARAAAFLHGLPGFDDPPLEILTSCRKIVPRCGVIVHHTKRLPRDQILRVHNIPCTSVERTVLDLCGTVGTRQGAIAVDHTLHHGMATLGSYDFCLFLTARRGRNGCGVLRDLVHERAALSEFPNTPLETVVFEMIAGSTLPTPQCQVPIHDERGAFVARPDFLYPQEKIIIEGHSRLWHTGFELERRDRARGKRLASLGYQTIYVTWADATSSSSLTLMTIERALRERGWTPSAGSQEVAEIC